ncbi:ABC transporter permease [Patulibacter minatonensis]|uniref:ABC transporter permease n=1 Tax=Patulibacter minatonensis TaxID=298163 RepID=UPI00047C4457|nr:ABC transporter permease [Patulibacter minatonensis]
MLVLTWLRGLVLHRRGRLVATTLGVAVAVALLASIGTFLSSTTSSMTERAAARVAVDWQVEAARGASPATVLSQVRREPGVQRALPVAFAETTGFQARSGGTVQHTGPGKVLGIPAGYAQAFPGQIRTLAGRQGGTGVLLAQQTAANLHAKPGDTVRIGRAGLPDAQVRVDAIVDLPQADQLFQKVGAPVGAQATAPPDNVVLLPAGTYQALEGPLVTRRPDLGRVQVHAKLSHALPGSPSAAYTQVSGHARNLETTLAGTGQIGDSLSVALDGARSDALYAQLLFLFLGLPGAVLAGLLTASVSSVGAGRRRRDAALLRTRGATTRQLVGVALAEAGLAGAVGIAVGLVAARIVGHQAFGTASFGAGPVAAIAWGAGSALVGMLIAAAAIAVPAWRDARGLTVVGQRRQLGRVDRAPWWQRYGIDVLCLIGAGLVFWQASTGGYQLVLAPEGVPQVSVNWYALLAPVLAWIGGGLLVHRLVDLVLARGRRPLARLLRPGAGALATTVTATMGRQRALLARAATLLALTAAFAGSTAVFNATYRQQAEADARLSNGSDVTVTESPGVSVGPSGARAISAVGGVRSVEPLQHRFAYVGADLQDLYGVRAATIEEAGALQNGWFAGGTASQLLDRIAQRPDSILVSAETVKDFQLRPGDLIRLRLQDGRTKAFRTVPFHYVGVAKEFPTAPKDSFFVANADYVAKATGSDAVGTFLVQTDGTNPATVGARLKAKLGTSAAVTDIVDERSVIGSNLTAVELKGLTRIELGFAFVLAAVASGLTLGLGFRERRRTFAIAAALGARSRQIGAFVWSEALFVTTTGVVLGAAMAYGLTRLLVKVLTGVFDPPPDYLSVPWLSLGASLVLVVVAVTAAGVVTIQALRRPAIEELRDL